MWLFMLPTRLFSPPRTHRRGSVFLTPIFSPNYPLKFHLPKFSPGGYYSGKLHQNPFSS